MHYLSSKQNEELQSALLSAFTKESELAELASYGLGKNLNEIEGSDLRAKCFYFIKWAASMGRLRELIVEAHDRRPRNDNLSAVADELLPLLESSAPPPPPIKEVALPGEPVSSGLLALSEVMKNPLGGNFVGEFSWRLEDARKQISVIGDYKDIHDLIHKLRSECYDPAIDTLEMSQGTEVIQKTFPFYQQNLRNIVTSIREVRNHDAEVKKHTVWLKEFDTLLEESAFHAEQWVDRDSIRRRLRRLHQLITDKSFRLNTLLKSAVTALNLSRLLELMSAVQNQMQLLNLEPERIQRITLGLKDLKKVALRLDHLVDSHDEFQFIDNILCGIEGLLETHGQQFLSDVELQWPILKGRTARIYKRKESWDKDFAETVDRLEAAIGSQDMVKTEQSFRYYRREVFLRFYRLDFTLKQQCHELQKLGPSISALLQVIQ
jgi:hypothetical protein